MAKSTFWYQKSEDGTDIYRKDMPPEQHSLLAIFNYFKEKPLEKIAYSIALTKFVERTTI